jgi:hypothetical protein
MLSALEGRRAKVWILALRGAIRIVLVGENGFGFPAKADLCWIATSRFSIVVGCGPDCPPPHIIACGWHADTICKHEAVEVKSYRLSE